MLRRAAAAAALCAAAAAVTAQPADGTYTIAVASSGLFLQANDLGDHLLSTRYQSGDGYARFVLQSVDGGAYRIRVAADGLMVHADDEGSCDVETLSQGDDGYNHFALAASAATPGAWEVRTAASGRAWVVNGTGFVRTGAGAMPFVFAAAEPPPTTGVPCVDAKWGVDETVVTMGIPYGSAYNNVTGRQQTLTLDTYFPPESDTRAARPAVVFVHGGSFTDGSSTWSPDIIRLMKELAARGFVAASINYRLLGALGLETDQAVLAASDDARAAVRFFRKMATPWRVDASRIMLSGESAGAITAMFVGYAKRAQREGDSGNPGFSSAIALSAPISGELKDQAYCRVVKPFPMGCQVSGFDYTSDVDGSAGQPPLLMVHGTADTIVPYVNAQAAYNAAVAAGLDAKLITEQGAGHVPWEQFFGDLTDWMRFVAKAMRLGADQCPK